MEERAAEEELASAEEELANAEEEASELSEPGSSSSGAGGRAETRIRLASDLTFCRSICRRVNMPDSSMSTSSCRTDRAGWSSSVVEEDSEADAGDGAGSVQPRRLVSGLQTLRRMASVSCTCCQERVENLLRWDCSCDIWKENRSLAPQISSTRCASLAWCMVRKGPGGMRDRGLRSFCSSRCSMYPMPQTVDSSAAMPCGTGGSGVRTAAAVTADEGSSSVVVQGRRWRGTRR